MASGSPPYTFDVVLQNQELIDGTVIQLRVGSVTGTGVCPAMTGITTNLPAAVDQILTTGSFTSMPVVASGQCKAFAVGILDTTLGLYTSFFVVHVSNL